jgi:hypothetical protein
VALLSIAVGCSPGIPYSGAASPREYATADTVWRIDQMVPVGGYIVWLYNGYSSECHKRHALYFAYGSAAPQSSEFGRCGVDYNVVSRGDVLQILQRDGQNPEEYRFKDGRIFGPFPAIEYGSPTQGVIPADEPRVSRRSPRAAPSSVPALPLDPPPSTLQWNEKFILYPSADERAP